MCDYVSERITSKSDITDLRSMTSDSAKVRQDVGFVGEEAVRSVHCVEKSDDSKTGDPIPTSSASLPHFCP